MSTLCKSVHAPQEPRGPSQGSGHGFRLLFFFCLGFVSFVFLQLKQKSPRLGELKCPLPQGQFVHLFYTVATPSFVQRMLLAVAPQEGVEMSEEGDWPASSQEMGRGWAGKMRWTEGGQGSQCPSFTPVPAGLRQQSHVFLHLLPYRKMPLLHKSKEPI